MKKVVRELFSNLQRTPLMSYLISLNMASSVYTESLKVKSAAEFVDTVEPAELLFPYCDILGPPKKGLWAILAVEDNPAKQCTFLN